ncbi:MAG: PaaI family thioesterase [Gammaproteobacteria bacterium]|nr:PaaI family thioesterase [Gammaproteobacteria bacterium]MDD9895476.1 PaaI family thioesterase [Gammaproteobacteria bacterium]MDD9957507.1 PaaI family thioesterase [Gammaproteobacteria bacterium]
MTLEKPPLSPFGAHVGVTIDDYAEGKCTCSVEIQDHHLNNGGRVHGGVLSSLADTAAGAAVRSVRPKESFAATTDLSISFIRPPTGNTLIAKAEVFHGGKQLYRVEIAIFSNKKLVAKCSTTFMIVEALRE